MLWIHKSLYFQLKNSFIEVEGILSYYAGRFNCNCWKEVLEKSLNVISIDRFEEKQTERDYLHVPPHSQEGSDKPFIQLVAIV